MRETILKLLKEQVKPAIGCTEPIAVALAVAKAKEQNKGKLKKIDVVVSPSIFKNGHSVTIPGTVKAGNAYAAALAYAGGKSIYGLQVLKDCNEESYAQAEDNLKLVTVSYDKDKISFYIKATVETDQGVSYAITTARHDNITEVGLDGKILFQAEEQEVTSKNTTQDISHLTLAQMREEIEKLSFEDLKFMLDGAEMNMAMSKVGLEQGSGMGVGMGMQKLVKEKIMEDTIISKVRIRSAGATDARMGGVNMPVMSSAGSGNHGITAIVPIKVVAEEYNIPDEKLVKAIAYSHLITYYVKTFTGRLSPICGCAIAAGVGATGGITYMLGGNDEVIAGAINSVIGNLTGILCDGAKHDCALKISTSSGEAVLAAFMAINGNYMRERNGIVLPNVEDSIRNLGKVCMNGMSIMDEEILRVML